jgi:L-fucose isomerase
MIPSNQSRSSLGEKHCQEGKDYNEKPHSPEQKAKEWEFCVKCAIIARDLMVGNPRLAELGFGEEAMGRNAILAGFQGQRQWTDYLPNGDFLEAILNSSFDWNGIREPYLVATENDSLNGSCMLLGHLLTDSAQFLPMSELTGAQTRSNALLARNSPEPPLMASFT